MSQFTVVTAKVDVDTARVLRRVAKANDRSISGEVRRVLRDWAAKQTQG